ncbi:hypothetical protein [Mycolicibacterium conceptionense]|uniref:hypothetical protein n=1 Tax=Mycolicibacterium conceptionense TaxID=451644 RepID=UPI0007E93C4D|nr:hypothetical protein [Mycolicibacterium conceptionense]
MSIATVVLPFVAAPHVRSDHATHRSDRGRPDAGKPGPPTKTTPLTPAEARLVARATALLAGVMLDAL